MTDPVEAAREALLWTPNDGGTNFRDALDAFEAAIRADVVPTGDAGLDHAPDCDVFRIAESWEPYGEPRHCDCGFALWDAKRRGVYNWTPPTGDAGLDVPLDVVMAGFEEAHIFGPDHDRRPIFECSYEPCRQRRAVVVRLSSSDTGEPTAQQRSLAEQHERGIHTVPEAWPGCPLCSSSDTGGRDGDVMLDAKRYDY